MPSKPFKPPRPQASKSGCNTLKPSVPRATGKDPIFDISSSDKSTPEQEQNPAATGNPAVDRTNMIPAPLIARLLHENLQDQDTRITNDGLAVFQRYVEVFAQETIHRANFERRKREREDGKEDGDEFLEVKDLEKIAGQMVLDF